MNTSRGSGPDLPGGSMAELATTLLRVFGDRAASLAAAQAEKASHEPEFEERWMQVARTIETLLDARAHMEQALSCLDAVGETSIAPHVDLAISGLSLDQKAAAAAAAVDGLEALSIWNKDGGSSATAGD